MGASGGQADGTRFVTPRHPPRGAEQYRPQQHEARKTGETGEDRPPGSRHASLPSSRGRAGVEVALQDQRRRGAVDAGLPVATADPRLGEELVGGHAGETLVPGHHRHRESTAQGLHEGGHLLTLRPQAPVEQVRHPHHDLPHAALAHERGHRPHVLARADTLEREEGRGKGGRLVGERHSDSDISHVEAQIAHTRQYSPVTGRRLLTPSAGLCDAAGSPVETGAESHVRAEVPHPEGAGRRRHGDGAQGAAHRPGRFPAPHRHQAAQDRGARAPAAVRGGGPPLRAPRPREHRADLRLREGRGRAVHHPRVHRRLEPRRVPRAAPRARVPGRRRPLGVRRRAGSAGPCSTCSSGPASSTATSAPATS